LLAVTARPIALDEAVESLWPEVDPETGRARMRNVLARVRAASGDLIRRDGAALAIARDVVIDAVEFEREGRAALAARATGGEEGEGRGVALARTAVARYAGELLPADRYEDFTVTLRERLALLYLALLDRLAADAERAGDVDEALRRYSDAIAAAPLDEHRYELAAALALRHGRRQRARELVDQAVAVLDDLGVGPSDRLAEIARELAAR
jgi:DNA-binding SARP family transcriptional activator